MFARLYLKIVGKIIKMGRIDGCIRLILQVWSFFEKNKLSQKGSIHQILKENNIRNIQLIKMFCDQLNTIADENREYLLRSLYNTYVLNRNRKNKLMCAFIDITYRCNLSCPHCLNKNLLKNDNNELMKASDYIYIIRKIKSLVNVILLSGGEPLLRKDIIRACKLFPDVTFFIFTNSLLIDNDYMDCISDIHNIAFIVSVDGDEIHHNARKGENTFLQAIKAISLIKERGYLCGVATVVDSSSYELLISDKHVENVAGYGANFLIYMYQHGENCDPKKYRYYSKALREKQQNGICMLPLINLPYDENLFNYGDCVGGKVLFHIDNLGNISKCPFVRSGSSDNVYKLSIDEICERLMIAENVCG